MKKSPACRDRCRRHGFSWGTRPASRLGLTIVAAGVVCLLSGCGREGPQIVPVEGRVTSAGGGWSRAGLVYFAPVEPAAGFPRLPGMGDVAQDGSFRVITQPDRDGLVPGTYRASLEIWEVPPTMGGPPPKSLVPPKYRNASTSGLELTVPSDGEGPVQVEWDIPRHE